MATKYLIKMVAFRTKKKQKGNKLSVGEHALTRKLNQRMPMKKIKYLSKFYRSLVNYHSNDYLACPLAHTRFLGTAGYEGSNTR